MPKVPRSAVRDEGDGRDGEAPLYQMVVKALRGEILRGLYPIGTTLPSESALVARFGVSRHTVREALRYLRDLGLVESRQGLGTLVLQPGGQQIYVHQVNSINDLHDFNVESRYDQRVEPVTADAALAERLRCAVGDKWLRIRGTRHLSLDEAPVCAVEIFLSARFAGIARLLGRRAGPIYSLIETIYGESISDVEQELRAVPLDSEVAAVLALNAGETAVEIRRVYRLLDGHPAEITFNHYKAQQFSFSMNLRRVRD